MEYYEVKKGLLYYFYFDLENEKDPNSSQTDSAREVEENLVKNAFKAVGFDVHSFRNLTKPEILNLLASLNTLDLDIYDTFALVIVSNMIEGRIQVKSEEAKVKYKTLSSNTIMQYLSGSKCEKLLNKPKIVFFQVPKIVDIDDKDEYDTMPENSIHVHTNMLIVRSSYTGWNKDNKTPTFYLEKLCEKLQSGFQITLPHMLVDLNGIMKMENERNKKDRYPIKQPIPEIMSTLIRGIILNPGGKIPQHNCSDNSVIIPSQKERSEINVFNFDEDHFKYTRPESSVDVENINETFESLDFHVNKPHINLSLPKFVVTLEEALKIDGKSSKFIFLMSHGEQSMMSTMNFDFPLRNIMGNIQDESVVNIFMAELSREGDVLFTDKNQEYINKVPTNQMYLSQSVDDIACFPIDRENIFFFFSTCSGDDAIRNTHTGSCFIQKLCNVIRDLDSGKDYNLLDICIKTSEEVLSQTFVYGENIRQLPVINMTLTNQVFIRKP